MGSLRETTFFAWLNVRHRTTASKVSDFEVEGYTFEVGGRNKGTKQLASIDTDKSFVVKDNIEYPALHSIPLWMFGFVY